MRPLTPLIITLLSATAVAQYSRPDVISSNPATTFQDNIVTPFAEMPVSPLNTIVKGSLPPFYTGLINLRRGRFELFYFNAGLGQQVLAADAPIPVGTTAFVHRPGTFEYWFVGPNSRTDVDPATGLPHAGGVVTVFDLLSGTATRTIAVGQGPSGIVFHPSGDVAWVSCRFSKDVHVIDANAGVSSSSIALDQYTPHAIDYNPARNEVLVASLLSGNNTSARGLSAGDLIPDVITHLPSDPRAANPLPDRDVVVLHVDPNNPLLTTADIGDARLATDVMTIQYNLTVDPHQSRAFVVGTDAFNAQFVGEKNFANGTVGENQLVVLDYPATGSPLETTVVLDNLMDGPMALPTEFVISPTQANRAWLVARGTDRVVEFDITPGQSPSTRGAWQLQSGTGFTGPLVGARLAEINDAGDELVVWCEVENSFAVIDVTQSPGTGVTNMVTTTGLSYDPMPDEVKRGWGHASDARRSMSESTSCLTCHVDGGSDNLLWDLSKWHDPVGTPSAQLTHEQDNKGPMLTQVLFGLPEVGPYHWRGEQQDLRVFNDAFADLMKDSKLSDTELDDLEAYMSFLRHAPNPNLSLDRDYANTPSPTGMGNVQAGLTDFRTFPIFLGNQGSCMGCHQLPTGTNNQVQNLMGIVGPPASSTQVGQLRGVTNRLDERFTVGGWFGERSRNGAGLVHHGAEGSFEHFLDGTVFTGLNNGVGGSTAKLNMAAYLESFDTGLAPAIGYQRVLDSASPSAGQDFDDTMSFVSAQAAAGHADFSAVIALPDGNGGFVRYPMFFDLAQNAFILNASFHAPLPVANLRAFFLTGSPPITVLGHAPGSGHSFAIDADDDQLLDGDESIFFGPDPFDADSDGDGFPDGYEVTNGQDPLTSNASSSDGTPPLVTGYRQHFVTTNTLKLELNTNEPARVQAFLSGPSATGGTALYPTLGLGSPANGAYTTNHQVVAAGLPSGVEFPFFPLPSYLMSVVPITFEVTDPAGNVTSFVHSVITGVRDHAVRVQAITGATFVPGSGGAAPTATFEVDLAAGTFGDVEIPGTGVSIVPAYPLPAAIPPVLDSQGNVVTPGVPEPVWDIYVKVSYGTQPGGSGNPVLGLTQLFTSTGNPLHVASQSRSLGIPTFTVTLPASAATDTDRKLLISVDKVLHDPNSGDNRGFNYIETQTNKRFHECLGL